MKALLFKLIVLFLLLLYTSVVKSQPQWKFHVAYEDATGAKDTIWFIWDTTATFFGLDTALGEKPVQLDYNLFNVWTHNIANEEYDTLKTIAHPYSVSFGHPIEAINFELPITIKWDSALFHAEWLPPEPVGWVNYARIQNDYFFLYNNMDFDHQFDMTLTHQVIAPEPDNTDPWVWEDWVHFPMEIYLSQDPTVAIDKIFENQQIILSAHPNPFTLETTFEINLVEKSSIELFVYTLGGQLVRDFMNKSMKGGKNQIKWSGLNHDGQNCEPGSYIAYLKVNGSFKQSIKLIIN